MVDVIRLGERQIVSPIPILEKIPIFGTSVKGIVTTAKVLASPVTTLALGSGLVGLLTGSPIIAGKTFLGVGLGLGALASSPKIREFARTKVTDPLAGGRFIGELVEDPAKLFPKDKPFKEKVKEGLTTAGIIGGIAAAGVGAGALVRSALEKRKEIKPKALPLPLLPAALPPAIQTFGVAEKVADESTFPLAAAPIKPMRIQNTFNPEINISFKKSKRFINQQINVK